MLKLRLTYGAIFIASVVGAVIVDGRWQPYFPIFAIVIATIVLVASRELSVMLTQTPLKTIPWVCQAGCLFIVTCNWLPSVCPKWSLQTGSLGPALTAFTLASMVVFVVAGSRYDGNGNAVLSVAGYVFAFFYVGVLGSFVVQLRWLGPTCGAGSASFLLAVFVAKGCDSGAYFAGRQFGRRRLAPILSPGKTWEGAAGGLFAAAAIAFLIVGLSKWILSDWPPFGWARTLCFGLVVGLVAQIGDLMESMIKRDCGQKDASNHIPGFGGLLDIIDSVLFIGPVAYLFFAFC